MLASGKKQRQKTLKKKMKVFLNYKILLMEKTSIPWKTVKGTWNSSWLMGRWNYEVAWKMAERSGKNGEYIVQ